jgi:acetylornithine deacetylase/succinyl-diaminopimelate desuccinylase-like protein
MTKAELGAAFDGNEDRYVAEWKELLRFPSISVDPARAADCLDCARWLVRRLAETGFDACLLETPSKPCVFAERKGDPGRPVILCYGHYDVQPVDPLAEWKTDPFQPELIDGRLYARGAEDNKGQLMYLLKALETLIRHSGLHSTVRILIEGEEECGSRGLAASAPQWAERLKADVLMITDVGTVGSGAPTLILGLRGVVFLGAELRGAAHDLHSGVHGGLAPNPAQQMARLVAGLHNQDGSIAVRGFYDGIQAPAAAELSLAERAGVERAEYLARTGIPATGGEAGRSAADRLGFRPTLEVNGLTSGYGGPGTKTIIPAAASVKLSARLVPGQDPERCLQAIVRHLKERTPEGLRLTVTDTGVGGPGFRLDPSSSLIQRARTVLDQLTEMKTALLWEGASIPIVTSLAAVSGAEPLLCGFGHEADNIHAPNESFSLRQFRLGYLYAGLMLQELQRRQ